jgi:hypothetical protein
VEADPNSLTGAVKEYIADRQPTPEEAAALVEMRRLVGDVLPRVSAEDREYWTSDHALRRFLTARGGKPEPAAAMYRATIAFRNERGCGRLLATYREPEVMRKLFPWGMVRASQWRDVEA